RRVLFRSRLETARVIIETKDPAVVEADAFEGAVAVEQPVVVDGDLRVVARGDAAVEPDRHDPSPCPSSRREMVSAMATSRGAMPTPPRAAMRCEPAATATTPSILPRLRTAALSTERPGIQPSSLRA